MVHESVVSAEELVRINKFTTDELLSLYKQDKLHLYGSNGVLIYGRLTGQTLDLAEINRLADWYFSRDEVNEYILSELYKED